MSAKSTMMRTRPSLGEYVSECVDPGRDLGELCSRMQALGYELIRLLRDTITRAVCPVHGYPMDMIRYCALFRRTH